MLAGVSPGLTSSALGVLAAQHVLDLLETLPLAVLVLDRESVVVYCNEATAELQGRCREDLVGRRIEEVSKSSRTPEERRAMWQSLMDGERWVGDVWVTRPDGGFVPLVATRTPITDEDGAVVGVLSLAVDRSAELEAQQIFRRTVEQSSDAFVAVDDRDRLTEWNPAAEKMFGWSAKEALGKQLAAMILPPSWRSAYRRGLKLVLSGEGQHLVEAPFEMAGVDRRGREFPVEVSVVRLNKGDRSQLQGFVRDISQRKAAEARLSERALTDELTNLPNRALLKDRLSGAIGRLGRSQATLAVMFIDVDRFKLVNDGLGHDAGDELLVHVGERIRSAVRANDTVARYGGDEFVIIAEDVTSTREPLLIAERVQAAVGAPLSIRNRDLSPSVSIGIVVSRARDGRPDQLIRNADVAMYRAKERGGRSAVVFDDLMGRRALGRFELEGDLRRAIDRGDLRVHYQPIVSLWGEIAGLEALVRWQHESRGLVPPNDFIPLAEETGLVVPLGLRVLEEAVRQVADWRRRLAPDLDLSVNISTRQLADPEFPARVAEILGRADFEPSAFCLEITETGLLAEPEAATASLQELRKLGVRLGVDDFGTGYSSLLYLRRFPVQVLKLDRFFVAGITTSHEDIVIAESVIGLARDLGMSAIAEGVETREQRDILRGLGCEKAQGFLWSRAETADVVEQWLATSPARLSPAASATAGD